MDTNPQTNNLEILGGILNAIPDPIFVKNHAHEFVLVNDAYCASVGHTRAELVGKADSDFFTKEETDVYHQKDDLVFQTKEQSTNEETYTDASGVKHTVVTKKTVYTDKDGSVYLVGIFHDITDRIAAAHKLQESEALYRYFVEKSRELIFHFDQQGAILFINQHACETLGYDSKEVVGKQIAEFVDPDVAVRAMEALAAEFQGNPQPTMEVTLKKKDGQPLVVEVMEGSVPMQKDGKIVGVMISCHDITERKRMEEALKKRNQELEQMNELMVGREMKMAEMKKRLAELENKQ